VAQAAGWKSAEQPGQWVKVERKFRDGSQQSWWALEVQAGPYGSEKTERAVIATTDPESLPDATTWYVVTNIPVPVSAATQLSELEAASLQDIVRLYGLRMWIEQSYKHVKHALGWSQYQVRSDQAIRRHWQLVCCAFSFCWYHASHPCSGRREDAGEASEPPMSQELEGAIDVTATGKKNQQRNGISSTLILAGSAAGRTRVVGALDHAAALLESLGRHAPTTSSPALA
jgi:hypothetical protein